MEDIRSRVGSRIRTLRKEQKISQETLALKAGLDRTYVASVENGRRNISIVNIEKLSVALDSSLRNFFDGEEFEGKIVSVKKSPNLAKVAENKKKKYK